MRRLSIAALCLVLTIGIHVDWHLARPAHHRLSLDWPQHWLFAAALFAAVGWAIARGWPGERWRVGGQVLLCAVLAAQVLEPLGEALFYEGRFGYTVEPERWRVFWVCLAAGVPAYALALWFGAPRLSRRLAA